MTNRTNKKALAAAVTGLSILGTSLGMATPALAKPGDVVNPLVPETYRYSSEFGPRCIPVINGTTDHLGQDMSTGDGQVIRAIANGTVTEVRDPKNGSSGQIVVKHTIDGKTIYSSYIHMWKASKFVKDGQVVKKGQKIAEVGSSGPSTGPHLHFEIWTGAWWTGTAINPVTYMKTQGVDLKKDAYLVYNLSAPTNCTYYASKNTPLRKSASDTGTVLKNVSQNQSMTSIPGQKSQSGRYVRVTVAGTTGWMHRDFVSPKKVTPTLPETTAPIAANVKYKTTANLNMRAGAGTSHSIVAVLNKGAQVVTTGKKSGTWLQVKSGSKTGWVSSAYLSKVSTPAPAPHNGPFTDVAPGANFFTSIKWMKDTKLTGGYTDGTFRPGKQITRGEFASFLYRYSGDNQSVTAKPFKDVPANNSHAKAITWMKAEGLTTGYKDGSFGLNKAITRGEVSAMLYRYAGDSSYKAPSTSKFKDLTTKSSYYKDISWLSSKGLISGYTDGTFKSSRAVTRGETSKFLYALDQKQGKSYTTTGNVNMRLGAGTGHAVVTVVKAGTKVTGTGKTSSGWVQVKVGSKTGWIAGSYLK